MLKRNAKGKYFSENKIIYFLTKYSWGHSLHRYRCLKAGSNEHFSSHFLKPSTKKEGEASIALKKGLQRYEIQISNFNDKLDKADRILN